MELPNVTVHKRQTSIERDINYVHVSRGGDDHQLVSTERQGVIPMMINTLIVLTQDS